MQKQKKENRQVAPRFMRAAVLTAGIMLSSCAGPQQVQTTIPRPAGQEKPPRDVCITIREAMQERVGVCKDSQDFSACVFSQRMLFSTKYESTEELEVEAGLKQDVLAELGIALMSNGRSRELIIREIRPDGVLFGMGFGMHDRATVPMGSKQLISIGGARKLERLDRVRGGEFFYRFDGSNEDEANARMRGMDVEIMSVQRTANGVRVRLVADLYENCLVE